MKRTGSKIKTLALLLATLFAFSLLPAATVQAASLDELLEIEAQIEEYRNNANQQKELAEALRKEIKILDQQMTEVENEITSLNKQIDEVELRLQLAQSDLDKASADKVSYQKQLEERMTVMYMYGDQGYIDVLFGATSFSDFINKATAIASIISYDNEIAQKLKETESLIEAKTNLIDGEKQNLEDLKTEQTNKEKDLEEKKGTKESAWEEIKAMEDYWQDLADKESEEASALRRELAQENSDGNFANTYKTFLWPTPGYYEITSPYGYRIHPVYGGWRFHSGVDIGAPRNARLIAPANGKVVRASEYGGYGNCVIIDLGRDSDGNTYKVLYGHLNSYAVSEGDIVTQGQTIGYAGMTGTATGYHLHFEVIINGNTYDPLDYLTK